MTPYEPRGRAFESLRAHHKFNGLGQKCSNPFFFSLLGGTIGGTLRPRQTYPTTASKNLSVLKLGLLSLSMGISACVTARRWYSSAMFSRISESVSYTHLRAHETRHDLVCRLLLEKKKKKK